MYILIIDTICSGETRSQHIETEQLHRIPQSKGLWIQAHLPIKAWLGHFFPWEQEHESIETWRTAWYRSFLYAPLFLV